LFYSPSLSPLAVVFLLRIVL